MNFRRLRALVRKEAWQIVRDPSSILIAAVLPVLLIFIFAYAVSLDVRQLRVGVVLEDPSPEAADLAQSIAHSPYLAVYTVQDRRMLEQALVAGKIRGFVVIPNDFSRKLNVPGAPPPIQIITDGSEPNTAHFVVNYVTGAWQVWNAQRGLTEMCAADPPVVIRDRVWYNPELLSRNFLLPGALALIMTLIGALLTALVVAREWERGTMEALLSTPITRSELILGKFIPYFLLGMGSLALSVGSMVWLYEVPLRGSLWLLFGVGAVFLCTALGLGLFISTIARSQFVACQIAFITAFMPAMMLSGFLFEISSMPAPIRLLSKIMPATYFVSSLHTLFLVGDVQAILLPNLGILFAVAVIFFLLIAWKTKRRLS